MRRVLINEFRGLMHKVLIDVDVKCCGQERMRDGQHEPAVEP